MKKFLPDNEAAILVILRISKKFYLKTSTTDRAFRIFVLDDRTRRNHGNRLTFLYFEGVPCRRPLETPAINNIEYKITVQYWQTN